MFYYFFRIAENAEYDWFLNEIRKKWIKLEQWKLQ